MAHMLRSDGPSVRGSDLPSHVTGRRHVRRSLLLSSTARASHDSLLELTVAQRAVLETQSLELCLQGLVLASLTGVVLLLQDALARSDARREVTAALAAVYVEFGYHRVAVTLRTLHLLAGLILRRVPRKELDRQVFVALALLLGHVWEPLQLHERF